MQQVFEQQTDISPSLADSQGLLSYPGAFALFQDLAASHAERLGIGLKAMTEKKFFWLTVRTKIVFLSRPALGETVTARTWPEKPGAVRCNRSYEISRGEDILIRGRTEWAILNIETRGITPSEGLFPALPFDRGPACTEPFARIPDRFEGLEPFAEYQVRSTDIDVGGHMNNAAYLRALFGAFSSRELQDMTLRSVDAVFRAPCFEGETLSVYRKEQTDSLDLRVARGEETVLLARFA